MSRQPAHPDQARAHAARLPGRREALLALAGLLGGLPALALDAPAGKVLLTVSGAVTVTNGPAGADFDLAMLDALPQHAFTTATPWFKTPRRFSGPLLRDVLAAAGAQGAKTLKAVALNNYKAEIPAEDARTFKMILATRLDDKPMSLREKGPLFIIYNFDESAELRQERYYSRSAWQLRALEVK
ncbi:molybdopterin-dependent oxidoreductase [Ideonella sp. DXS22W]|uniref:Molybdopterin-dependent oxidoreductase n=1 Tax=Pseudaquabacterium inlustre TaxID=2984192 RepID=A0ABU9CI25_9BURK